MPKRYALLLLFGDGFALSLFVITGVLTHEQIFTFIRFGLNIVPLMAAWTLAAWLWGALRVAELQSYRTMLGRTLTAWLIAAPIALVLRAYLTGTKYLIVIFLLVALGLGGAFLLAWRALAVWLMRRGKIAPAKEPLP